MSDLTVFTYADHPVRTVVVDGEPWFVAADVCGVLDHSNTTMAVAGLDEDEKGLSNVDTPGGSQRMAIVSEAGLYSLIIRSRRPEAKAFKRWITHDVLPQIRRTGSYGATPELTGPELMARALIEAQSVLAAKDEQIAVLEPKAEAFEAFLSTAGDYSVRDAAHVLSRHHDILTGEKRLRGWMFTAGWLYRDATGAPRAYQRRIDQGFLAERAQWHYHPESGEKVADSPQVRVTARGIEALARALTKVTDQGELDIEADERAALGVSAS